MNEITEILKDIKRGDKTHIAELTGASLDMVIKVLKGERSSDVGKGKLIIMAGLCIIRQRRVLEQMYREEQKTNQHVKKTTN
jgi:hypothetical protein